MAVVGLGGRMIGRPGAVDDELVEVVSQSFRPRAAIESRR